MGTASCVGGLFLRYVTTSERRFFCGKEVLNMGCERNDRNFLESMDLPKNAKLIRRGKEVIGIATSDGSFDYSSPYPDPEYCLGNAGISTFGIFIDPDPSCKRTLTKKRYPY